MVIFGVGCWIKDSNKKEASRLKRDGCKHYNRRSGSCFKYKVICCHNCKKWEQKRDRPMRKVKRKDKRKDKRKENREPKKLVYRLKINIMRFRIVKQEIKEIK